jgi:catechol 2,3-dioxygenase-like lactoylglutathione lyase family enzyme
VINIEDIAYVRVAVPDLEAQERFLTDFGMYKVVRTETALYMRGAGPQPVVHISELQTPGFAPGLGVVASSLEDLEATARAEGASVVENEEPGGGRVVRLIDPHGYRVDLLHRATVDALPMRSPMRPNVGFDRTHFQRLNGKIRIAAGPSTVMRMGHLVMKVPDVNVAADWYRKRFGLVVSDSVHVPDNPAKWLFAFLRCGLGERFVDHHSIAFLGVPGGGFDHSAYEVIDIEDLMLGGAHLEKMKYHRSFGIGRHIGGSMVFDYWRDTGGNKIEHWTDGDHVNQDYESTHLPMGAAAIASWGPEVTPEFFK